MASLNFCEPTPQNFAAAPRTGNRRKAAANPRGMQGYAAGR